jgi:hypothetical protein
MRISTANMQGKPVNQKRGPTTGNQATGTKRADFMAEKAKSGSEKSELANMITDAVAARGRGMQSHKDKSTEGLHTVTNTGRGPTKGNAGRQQKSAAARKGAVGATSGY